MSFRNQGEEKVRRAKERERQLGLNSVTTNRQSCIVKPSAAVSTESVFLAARCPDLIRHQLTTTPVAVEPMELSLAHPLSNTTNREGGRDGERGVGHTKMTCGHLFL